MTAIQSLTTIQYAWIIYAAGSLGCCIATWWMFLWAWRFVRYSAVVTVMTILLTPYAIDPQTMMMAPAIYTMVFNGMAGGLPAIMPLIKLMLGIWSIAIILVLVFVLLTRNLGKTPKKLSAKGDTRQSHNNTYKPHPTKKVKASRKDSFRDDVLSYEERQARDELLAGEQPMRALRD